MRIAIVAGAVMVLAMAAPAMADDDSWKRDDRGRQHVRYGDDRGDHRDGDRWRRDGDHRWNDRRRGDDDRRGSHDWWRDGKDGDRDRRYGDRDHPGRHLGHRKHDKDKDKWHGKDKDKWHGKDKDRDKDKHTWHGRGDDHDGRDTWHRDGRDGHRDGDHRDGRDRRQTWYGSR